MQIEFNKQIILKMSENNNLKSFNTISAISKDNAFGLAWLDSSYLETLLPGSPWQNVCLN